MDDDNKKCCGCGEILPKTEEFFYPGKNNQFWGRCKSCEIQRKHEWRAANRESDLESTRKSVAKWRANNLEESQQYMIDWRASHPDQLVAYKERERIVIEEYGLKALYRHGITQPQRVNIREFQDCKCAICGTPISFRGEVEDTQPERVDHSHENGYVRGLLCNSCNTRLGWYENQAEVINEYICNPPTAQIGLAITTPRRQVDPAHEG